MRAQSSRSAPLVPGEPLFGNIRHFSRDQLGFCEALRDYGPVVAMRFGPNLTHFLYEPDAIKRVLQDNHRNYTRHRFGNALLTLFLGQSLLTTDGDSWLTQRRLMSPMFHRQRIAGFAATMVEAAETLLADWEPLAARGEAVDVAEAMMGLTFRIVGLTLFSVELSETTDEMGRALTEGQGFFNYRTRTLFAAPLWLPTHQNRRFRRAKQTIHRVLGEMIEGRRASGVAHEDLLGMLMSARDEATGEGMSDQQILDETVTMVSAGHETTANALSWTWHLLATHPEAEARLHDELARVLGGRAPTFDDLPQLAYTRRVLDETMRLYPPAWLVSRQSIGEDALCGYRIPADSGLILPTYAVHRHPALWEEPTRFDPDRFLPERSEGRPRFAYFPFGGGPHLCIGQQFALTEATLLLAALAQRVRLRPVAGHPIVAEPLITLRPKHGVPMRLAAR